MGGPEWILLVAHIYMKYTQLGLIFIMVSWQGGHDRQHLHESLVEAFFVGQETCAASGYKCISEE